MADFEDLKDKFPVDGDLPAPGRVSEICEEVNAEYGKAFWNPDKGIHMVRTATFNPGSFQYLPEQERDEKISGFLDEHYPHLYGASYEHAVEKVHEQLRMNGNAVAAKIDKDFISNVPTEPHQKPSPQEKSLRGKLENHLYRSHYHGATVGVQSASYSPKMTHAPIIPENKATLNSGRFVELDSYFSAYHEIGHVYDHRARQEHIEEMYTEGKRDENFLPLSNSQEVFADAFAAHAMTKKFGEEGLQFMRRWAYLRTAQLANGKNYLHDTTPYLNQTLDNIKQELQKNPSALKDMSPEEMALHARDLVVENYDPKAQQDRLLAAQAQWDYMNSNDDKAEETYSKATQENPQAHSFEEESFISDMLVNKMIINSENPDLKDKTPEEMEQLIWENWKAQADFSLSQLDDKQTQERYALMNKTRLRTDAMGEDNSPLIDIHSGAVSPKLRHHYWEERTRDLRMAQVQEEKTQQEKPDELEFFPDAAEMETSR